MSQFETKSFRAYQHRKTFSVQYFMSWVFFGFFFSLSPLWPARFMIIPLWHKRPGRAPLTPAIWLSRTTLGYTVAHSAIDWGVEGQLFNTSEQQVLLSSWPFSCLVSAPPKNVSYLVPSARVGLGQTAYACIPRVIHRCAFGATPWRTHRLQQRSAGRSSNCVAW